MATYSVYFSNAGVPATGLTLVWNYLKIEAPNNPVTPQPTFTDLGGGFYRFTASPPSSEVWIGVIDGSVTLANADRYVPVRLSPEDVNLDAAMTSRASASALDIVNRKTGPGGNNL